jgi:tetratricopeptide (TPR) repeat protein
VVKRLIAGFLVLVFNSAYLAAHAEATLFYFANIVLHLSLGFALGVAWLMRLRRGGWPRGALAGGAAALLLAALATGVALTLTGATRPWRFLLVAHIALATLGSLLLLVRLARALRATDAPGLRRALAAGLAVAGAAIVAAAVLVAQGRPQAPRVRRIANPAFPPLTMEGEGAGAQSPFFPSSAETDVGGVIPADFFLTSESCGRCHKAIYEQWRSSAHHFSSFNNQWYRKSIEYMQDVVGTRPSKWCAGCHDHAVFFNGRFDRPIKEQIHTPEAQAGLGCTSCHSIVHVKSTMGQGDFTIEYPPLHDLAVSDNRLLRWGHDFLLRLDPQPHRQTFLKSFHRERAPEFCSSCHKVHLDVPVNAYRWLRGFNEYDNWQASGVSGQGARSFYYPPKPQQCHDCHMPLVAADDPAARDGHVHSHRFPGANTALPYVNGDAEQLRVTQEFLQAGQVTLDVFALARAPAGEAEPAAAAATAGEPRLSSTFAVGEEALHGGAAVTLAPAAEVSAPLDLVDAAVRRGESVRVDVVVRTRGVGHFFPGGTVDAFDVWVELEARDEHGRVLLHSGALEGEGGPVDPAAHFYRSLMLDEHGNPINKRNAWMTRSVAYVRLIPPGAADTVRYRLSVPKDCGERITLRARLNYRKFAWWHTQWAFAGVRDPSDVNPAVAPGHDDGRWVFTGDTSDVSGGMKRIPDLPVTVMARAEATLRVLPASAPVPGPRRVAGPKQRERFNDYGIGLLLQGDIKAAEAAFLEVTRADPAYADGFVNVARARIQEGNLPGAEELLARALALDPALAKTHFFLALVRKSQGRYDEALDHLRRTLEPYPRDRVALNQLGRLLFLKRRYSEARAALQAVLAIDPEDLQAHYNLMLCARGLGDDEAAKRHEALYRRFKADESAQEITGPFRRLHPHDNNERQPIHEHANAVGGRGEGEVERSEASLDPADTTRRASVAPRGPGGATPERQRGRAGAASTWPKPRSKPPSLNEESHPYAATTQAYPPLAPNTPHVAATAKTTEGDSR